MIGWIGMIAGVAALAVTIWIDLRGGDDLRLETEAVFALLGRVWWRP